MAFNLAYRCSLVAFALIGTSLSTNAIASRPVQIGSKANIESETLGEMALVLAAQAKVPAVHRSGLGGTQVLWKALRRGDIDLYVEYTGTLEAELLSQSHVKGLPQIRAALEKIEIAALDPLGFENSYALGMRDSTAQKHHISKISDLRRFPELKFGFSHEFMDRAEGWPSTKKKYGLPQEEVRAMEHEVTYLGLASGAIDLCDLYTTDAEIAYYHLVALEDDLHIFPQYQALFLYRTDLESKAPELIARLRQLSGLISPTEMISMNSAVKIEKQRGRNVVENFLRKSGLLQNTNKVSATSPFWGYTREHLYLVSISLFLTILVAVPLGVLASLRPKLGEVILAVAGIIQTIPSLALLVFMIPLLGIGAKPALMALFLYGLLPILRNTYTALRNIPRGLLESAEALGLPRWVRLVKIELPLSAKSILAGIKTSAVINVGTATLGAIIGAGGYGEPILMGIRRDDISLILQGAIPSAALAIIVQLLFEGIEKYFIPRGLRLGR